MKKGKLIILLSIFFLCDTIFAQQNFNIQYIHSYKDYKKFKTSQSPLFFSPKLSVSNDYSGNYISNFSKDFRNLTLFHFDFQFKKIPIKTSFGREFGTFYDENYERYIFNFNIDLQSYFNNLKSQATLKVPNDEIDSKLLEEMIQDEIKNQVGQAIQKGYSAAKLDSLQDQLNQLKSYEALINSPSVIQEIQNRKTILRERAMGNKIEGLNYDSITLVQNDFEHKTNEYNQLIKKPDITDYRKKYDEVTKNKDKVYDIKNKAESKFQSYKNQLQWIDKIKNMKFELSRLSFGQSSIDHSDLVFRGFMVYGLNIEMKSPFYAQFVYSLPFQMNLISNYQITSMQNNQVSTLGGIFGISKDKKLNAQLGYFKFHEKQGLNSYRTNSNEIDNDVILLNSNIKTKKYNLTVEIGKSATSKFGNQSIFSMSTIDKTSAIKLKNEWNFTKTNTLIQLDLQRIGLQFYSSANPFIQRGTGFLTSIQQNFGAKLSLKSKISYRFGEDSNCYNQILQHSSIIKYKLNKKSNLELRTNYNKTNLEFGSYYLKTENQIYTLQWLYKLKSRFLTHAMIQYLQYQYNKFEASPELNSSGEDKNYVYGNTYALNHSKFNATNNLELIKKVDSNRFVFSENFNFQYSISTKTSLNFGFSGQFEQSYLSQRSITGGVITEIGNLSIQAVINYSEDMRWKMNAFQPQVRIRYNILNL